MSARTPRPISVDTARYLFALYGRKTLFGGKEGCREWAGPKQSSGYGQIRFEGLWYLAHRVAWTALRGEIPPGLTIDHVCENRGCQDVNHMEVVTLAENTRRVSVRRKERALCGVKNDPTPLATSRRAEVSP